MSTNTYRLLDCNSHLQINPSKNITSYRFFDRVLSSAAQGSVAAVVGAGLGAVAEPVVNTVLVKRVPVNVALKEFSKERAWKMFWQATLPTNMIKFPFYEVINMILKEMSLPETGKGAITGAIFTTATLPLGNYRFMKSMNMEITFEGLWKAYLPTLLRDVIYGIVRSNVSAAIDRAFPSLSSTAGGRFLAMFLTALTACIVSSPGNELRGYCLQPHGKFQGFGEFFQPRKYIRSTSVGATNLALSLGTGTLVVEPLKRWLASIRDYAKSNPLPFAIIVLMVGIQLSRKKKRNRSQKMHCD